MLLLMLLMMMLVCGVIQPVVPVHRGHGGRGAEGVLRVMCLLLALLLETRTDIGIDMKWGRGRGRVEEGRGRLRAIDGRVRPLVLLCPRPCPRPRCGCRAGRSKREDGVASRERALTWSLRLHLRLRGRWTLGRGVQASAQLLGMMHRERRRRRPTRERRGRGGLDAQRRDVQGQRHSGARPIGVAIVTSLLRGVEVALGRRGRRAVLVRAGMAMAVRGADGSPSPSSVPVVRTGGVAAAAAKAPAIRVRVHFAGFLGAAYGHAEGMVSVAGLGWRFGFWFWEQT